MQTAFHTHQIKVLSQWPRWLGADRYLGTYYLMECLHLWVKVDQASRPLAPKSLNILIGLTLKLDSLCITVSVIENIWTGRFGLFLEYFVLLLAWKGLFW